MGQLNTDTVQFCFLAGNVSEGFTVYGPYESFDEAADTWEGVDGWVTEIRLPPLPLDKPAGI